VATYDPVAGQWRMEGNTGPGTIRGAVQRAIAPPGSSPRLDVPTITDEAVLVRQLERKQRLASLRGRASTFLTGPRGIGAGLPTSDIALAFLRAGLEEPGPYPTTSGSVAGAEEAFEEREAPPTPSRWRDRYGAIE
jgi:hypothetical protein